MAILVQSNKKPSVSYPSQTGSIVTFNSQYAGLPLKSCTSLISGYQEGSGTPSPSNPRTLHPFSSGTLTANSDAYTFTFGQSIYQGYIDWLKGVVVGLWSGKVDMGLLNWGYNSSFQAFYISLPNMYIPTTGQERLQGIANEVYPISTVDAISLMNDKSCLRYNGYLWTKDSDYTDRDDFKNSLIGKYVAYELATPIEIPLGGVNLLTQQGTNNIFADCGDTTVQYIKIGG